MGRVSPLERLPEELRRELNELLTSGRFSLEQVVAHMRKLGVETSDSALSRYNKKIKHVVEKRRMAREIATATLRELGDLADANSGRLVTELLTAMVLDVGIKMSESGEATPKDIGQMARATKDLVLSQKASFETEIRARAIKDAASAASKACAEQGLSAATVDIIKEQILGIAKRP